MQTAKARVGSMEVPKNRSLQKPQIVKKMKSVGPDSNGFSGSNLASKNPKDRNVKVVARKSPRSPVNETKRSTKLSELETQITQLQEELNTSETRKRRAHQEAEEAKKHLSAMSAKLEETQRQIKEITENEDVRVLELRKISHDRDREWKLELEAIQKQHSLDSAALISSMNEIQRLTRIADSAHMEIHNLRGELAKSLALIEKLKSQVAESKESETHAIQEVNKVQIQLEAAKITEETLRAELEQSNNRLNSSNNTEASQLREALSEAERKYKDEYTSEIKNAYKLVEQTKTQSSQREAELKAKLSQRETEIEAKFNQREANLEAKLESEIKKRENEGFVLAENEELKLRVMEMEGELKRVKVQADQWRKATMEATTILSGGDDNNENFLDFSENFMEKKNGNMLKKFGVLLKKGQK